MDSGGYSAGIPLVTGSLEDIPAVPGEKVWTGYEWSLEGTAYKKSSTITEGLAWSSIKPEVGKIYTKDALVEVASLYQVVDEDNNDGESGGNDSSDSDIITYNYSELDVDRDAYVDSDQLSKLFVPVGEKVRIKTRFASPDKDTIYIRIQALGSNLGLEGPMEDNLRLLTEDGTVKYTSYQSMPQEHEILENNLPNGNYYIELDNTDGTQQISMKNFHFNAYGDATGISDWVESDGQDAPETSSTDLIVTGADSTESINGTYKLISGNANDLTGKWYKKDGGWYLYCQDPSYPDPWIITTYPNYSGSPWLNPYWNDNTIVTGQWKKGAGLSDSLTVEFATAN